MTPDFVVIPIQFLAVKATSIKKKSTTGELKLVDDWLSGSSESGGSQFSISADGAVVAVKKGMTAFMSRIWTRGTHQRVDVSIDGVIGDETGEYGTTITVSPDGNLVATSGSTNLVAGGSSDWLFVKNFDHPGEISIASTSKMGTSKWIFK